MNEKAVYLWSILRSKRNLGKYGTWKRDIEFLTPFYNCDTFADAVQYVNDSMVDSYKANSDIWELAIQQYESRQYEIEHWFQVAKKEFLSYL